MGSRKKKPAKAKVKTLSLINMKVSPEERKILTELAAKHARGNLSKWLRHAGRHYKPAKGEVIR